MNTNECHKVRKAYRFFRRDLANAVCSTEKMITFCKNDLAAARLPAAGLSCFSWQLSFSSPRAFHQGNIRIHWWARLPEPSNELPSELPWFLRPVSRLAPLPCYTARTGP